MLKFKLNKFTKKKLKAEIVFKEETAKKLVDTSYYSAQAKNLREIQLIESEKIRLSTPKWEKITKQLEYYKQLGESQPSGTGTVLLGLYNKNKEAVLKKEHAINSNLLSIIAKPETLMLAYREIRGNKGALTNGAAVSKETYLNMNWQQKELYYKSFSLPDGMSLYYINLISYLIRKNKYIWGSSSRVYFDKPGQPNKKRPITIPPFTDRMVQKAIELVLQAIYEPVFESLNRSFGFRPNKGCHDALAALLSKKTNGMRTAIEGDVEAAYDTVNKKILLAILEKRIQDKSFIKFIEERLNYDYVEKETNQRSRPESGIPQGGIDSPYLFNIYMNEMDEYVLTEIQTTVEKLNTPIEVERKFSKMYTSNRARKKKLLRALNKTKKNLTKLPTKKSLDKVTTNRANLFKLIKDIRLNEHKKNWLSTSDASNRKLRIFYVRYADDWIVLTNGSSEIARTIKDKISTFLKEKLMLTLSEKKTLITDITKESAKFLGFELRISPRGALRRTLVKEANSKKRYTVSKKSGLLLWAQPDRQRLINRYHMKGFCSRDGFPRTLPWLSTLEAHAIVDRFNATIRGCAQYYLPVIRNRAKVHRWIYILRYACLKTLAQKYKCTIRKIFRRFGHNLNSKSSQTIKIRVQQKVRGEEYYKDWILLTYSDIVKGKHKQQMQELISTFWDREEGTIGEYPNRPGRLPKVTNENFLEQITWVSWRTAAAINMPCAYCGTDDKVQQHHIKAVRKRAYSLIPAEQSYQKMLALRNRKQIPLCEKCHMTLVHGGKYNGPKLMNLAPTTKLIDNRIIHVESFVKPGAEYHAKSLTEKGWTQLNKKKT